MTNTMPPKLLHGRAVSEVFQDFMEPLLIEWRDMRPRPSLKRLNEMLRTPWCIWNAVVFHDFYPNADKHRLLDDLRRRILQGPEPGAIAMIDVFIERKRSLFGQFRYLFGEFEFYKAKDGEIRCRAMASLPNSVVEKYGRDGAGLTV